MNGLHFTQQRHVVELFEDLVLRQREQRALPELGIVMAEEVVMEQEARGRQRRSPRI
jgi:hypothetical protein